MTNRKLVALALGVLGAGPARAAAPDFPDGTILVDDDGVDCPDATFSTIQAAVDAAQAGGTVGVCPGSYAEAVHVDKALTLLGALHDVDGRTRTLQAPGESVVTSDRPFSLAADGVTLDGFTLIVEPDASGEGWGVLTSDAFSGYRIEDNVMDADGVTAVFPGCSGATVSTVRHNHFYDRLGVATSGDEPIARAHGLRIVDNRFSRSSLLLDSGEDTDVVVLRNRFDGGGTLHVTATTRATVRANRMDRPGPDAIVVGASTDVVVTGNVVQDAAQSALGVFGDNVSVVVSKNRVTGAKGGGLVLAGASGVDAVGNVIKGNGAGITATESYDSRIRFNDVEDNATAGIRLGVGSHDVTVEGNVSRGNQPDCIDQTLGTGTAGTANVWTSNVGTTSTPTGLCSEHPSSGGGAGGAAGE